MSSPRAKYSATDLDSKHAAIMSIVSKSKTNVQVALELKVSKNTVNGWIREKDKIIEQYNSNTKQGTVKKIKNSARPQVDEAMLEWFKNLQYLLFSKIFNFIL